MSQPSLRDYIVRVSRPSHEWLGYCRPSLRDFFNNPILRFVRCPASIAGAVDDYMQTMLDALLVSVQVEITIIDVTDFDNRELGVDWDLVLDQMRFDRQISVVATGASGFFLDPADPPFNLSITRPHGDGVQKAVVKALRDYAKVRVIEQTTLSLRNNTAATIRRGTNTPYIESIITSVTSVTSQTSIEKSSVLSGVDIGVMANVYKDDLVSLSLTPKVLMSWDIKIFI